VLPGIEAGSAARAALLGALYGLFTYATYDLTNLATLKDWPVPIVFIDIAWGILICAGISAAAFGIGSN